LTYFIFIKIFQNVGAARGDPQARKNTAAVGCAAMWSLRNMADADKRAAMRKKEKRQKA